MKEGTLYFDRASDRYDVIFEDGEYYGGLHCGDCFHIMREVVTETAAPIWIPAAIEYNHDKEAWYLTGAARGLERLDGLRVRM